VSDDSGAFEVVGVGARRDLWFHHPRADEGTSLDADDWADASLRVVLTREGFVAPDEPERAVGVRSSAPLTALRVDEATPFRLVRDEDGRAFEDAFDVEDSEPGGLTRHVRLSREVRLRAGRWRAVSGPFRRLGFSGTFEVGAEGPNVVALESDLRPRLSVDGLEGDLLESASIVAEGHPADEPVGDVECLASAVRAVVRVEDLGRTFFAEVGPAADGVRRALLRIPSAHRLRVEGAAAKASSFSLVLADDPGLAVSFDVADGLVLTRAQGRVRLRFETEDGAPRQAEVELPAEPGAGDILVRAQGAGPAVAAAVEVRATLHDGTPVRASVRHETPSGGSGFSSTVEGWEIETPFTAFVESPGLQPRILEVKPGDVPVARFGPCSLRLSVVRADDPEEPVEARVALDHWVHDVSDEEPLDLGGLDEGPHEAFVVSSDSDLRGVRLRFTLRAGETLVHEVRLLSRAREE
jgi:hypothetical protein